MFRLKLKLKERRIKPLVSSLRNDYVEMDISLMHETDHDSHGIVVQGTVEGKGMVS